ncbi:hypothetical protein A8L34_07025 [Bacillus sp. FJAT-27264]|uniref:anti-sigma factor n=1 Tax=Paenibacillus sp. (strain DSM 101736 / FJAT-27264) TaxID=1850362 RepID=UPI000807CC06|nr:anti-sigma factor [Bacillus sp. FJAT-27264]OBZ19263.1 hypothetical protein A8L34_07025 [Bacillus sp. FJAT-27264]
MKQERSPLCDLCLSIILGECTPEERLAFEHHLADCKHCLSEMKELEAVWGVLYADMESIQPPHDLKEQVMNAAWAADKQEKDDEQKPQMTIIPSYRKKKSYFWPLTVAVTLFLLAGQSAWILYTSPNHRSGPLPIEEALSVSAAQIQMAVPLHASSPQPQVNGIACIVDNGHSKQFVVYVYGAAVTSGDEAYQVWLIKDGIRTSAGTFRVTDAEKGIGVLAMPIETGSLSFDKIGITLEPDDKGSEPRGSKVLGS